jgi:chromosome segregation ATPase
METSEALLVQLEERMDSLTNLVVVYRDEKGALEQNLADCAERQKSLEQENSSLKAEKMALEAEKDKIILKLETLLARFDGYGQ